MSVTLKTDSSIAKPGFKAFWTAQLPRPPPMMKCQNKTIVQNTGWLQSPGYEIDPLLDGVKIEQESPVDCWLTLQAPGKNLILNKGPPKNISYYDSVSNYLCN